MLLVEGALPVLAGIRAAAILAIVPLEAILRAEAAEACVRMILADRVVVCASVIVLLMAGGRGRNRQTQQRDTDRSVSYGHRAHMSSLEKR